MSTLFKLFRWGAIAGIIAIAVSLGLSLYGEVDVSEAAQMDQGFRLVEHQTEGMGAALTESGRFVSEDITPGISQPSVADASDIDTLIALWEPRFSAAQQAYARFAAAIKIADQQANAYLDTKKALSERFNNAEQKAAAQQEDAYETQLYQAWHIQSLQRLENAAAVLRTLEDLDTGLRRLQLTANFTFDIGQFETVPMEIATLNDSLAEFQGASERIRAVTKSPFER